MDKIKSIVQTVVFAVVLLSVSVACWLKPDDAYSDSERRLLATMPQFNLTEVLTGDFMDSFEGYTTDQFPFRDRLRTLKAVFSTKVLQKLDNNGIFTAEGHISKIDGEENEYMTSYAANLFKRIVDTYVTNEEANIYFSIVPDKNFVLANKNGYPSMDYEGFIERMKNKTEFMQYIDIAPLLSLDDYYTTDTHWRQEKIIDIAHKIGTAMGANVDSRYMVNRLDVPFYGVYTGQLALKYEPDSISYLTNETIDNCIVTYYNNGQPERGSIYNMEKAYGKDPYEMFLSGTAPLITIENTFAQSDKELVLFRDSFGSSLAPLLIEGYKKITVVDIRYIQSSFIGDFVTFDNCDVLFLYSTAVLNSSLSMK